MMRKMNRKIRSLLGTGRLPGLGCEGFTLVEIMMVLMILSVGVLPIAVIQHRARGEVSEADRYTQGIEIAQIQALLKPQLNTRQGTCDFAGDKGLAANR